MNTLISRQHCDLASRRLAPLLLASIISLLAAAKAACAQGPFTLLHSFLDPGTNAQFSLVQGWSVAVDGDIAVAGAPGAAVAKPTAGVAKVYNATTGALLHTLTNPSPAAGDMFGNSVAVSGMRVVVGAYEDDAGATNAGSAYVFDLASPTPTVPVATLHNPSPAYLDRFGFSVGISGTHVVVGAYLDDTGILDAGIAYVYDLTSPTPSVPVVTLNNPDPTAFESFGRAVAISGTRVVVGAYFEDTGANAAGSAYVYDLASATPAVPVTTINHPLPTELAQFGHAVAISGTRVVVGAFADDTGGDAAGGAYVYDLASGTPTVPVATLTNPSPASSDFFGYSVAIAGTRVVVGAPFDDTVAIEAGNAYVYDLTSATPNLPVATLTNPGPTFRVTFGFSVAASGSRMVVGAYGAHADVPGGSAYVYDFANGTAVPVATLKHPSPAAGDNFGHSVALSGTRIVVGAREDDTGAENTGTAYVYDLANSTPTGPAVTLNNPIPALGDHFGSSVALSGTLVVVGAADDDAGAVDAGRVYVYDLAKANPTVPVATLSNPSPAARDHFGFSVALSGTHLVVGAPEDDTGATNAGSAYVYDMASVTPTVPVVTLNNPSPTAGDFFGYSVDISGTLVVVGVWGDDTGATNAGSACVYNLAGPTPTVPLITLTNPSPAADDRFGVSLAISGTRVVVGVWGDDTGATNAGSACVFNLAGPTPGPTLTVPFITLTNPSPTVLENFGSSVRISGTLVVVGAPLDDTGSTDTGSAYLYDVASATPTVPFLTLTNPSPTEGDQFGFSVALDGTSVVVGTPFDGTAAVNRGAAYIFGVEPQLRIVPAAPGYATISWTPTNLPGFLLQHTDSLAPTNWLIAPSGAANPITVPVTNATRFHRLFKP